MSDGTKIEWSGATWNPITGCSLASPGCTNCYAMLLAGTRLSGHPSRASLTHEVNGNHVWTGEVRFNEQWLCQPLRWKKPRLIFVCAHGDLFHESVPDEWIDRVFAVMALCPQHIFQVLTKRAARMREYVSAFVQGKRSVITAGKGLAKPGVLAAALHRAGEAYPACTPLGPLPNVWLGVSAEDQRRADERIPDLLVTPAAVRWLSCEPLLGAVDLTWVRFPNERGGMECYDALSLHLDKLLPDERWPDDVCKAVLDWVVAGGESGPNARPMHPDWARSLRDQCAAAGVPFFFKQWGEFVPAVSDDDDGRIAMFPDGADSDAFDDEDCCYPVKVAHGREFWRIGKKRAGRLLDGVLHDAMPGYSTAA